MRNLARFVVLAAFAAVAVQAFAGAVILEDARTTFKQAVAESNKPKAEAMLRGLLMSHVTVAVDPSTIPVNAKGYEDGVKNGLTVWNRALNEELFVMAQDPESADILVSFVEKVDGADGDQGAVTARRTYAWKGAASTSKISGDISIRDTAGRRSINGSEIAAVTSHELGHLLGLADDPDGSGIMSDFEPGRSFAPSSEEIAAVLAFRTKIRAALEDL